MAEKRALTRIMVNVGLDALLAAAAIPLATWLADPGGNPFASPLLPLWGAAALLLAGLPFRLSVQYWRFAGIADLLGVAAGSVMAAAIYTLGLHLFGVAVPSPAFPVLHALCLLVLLGVPRMGYRMLKESPQRSIIASRPVLLVGGGEGADLFLRALAGDSTAPYYAVGVLTLGKGQTGRRIHGVPIVGGLDDAAAVLERQPTPPTLVVTDPDISGSALAALIVVAEVAGARVARAPRPTALDLSRHTEGALTLKPVAIEDLLNRPQVPLDRAGMARLVQGQRVLVTGAGGTIGSEMARQVAALGPAELVLLDNGEYALWQIDLELGESYPDVARRTVLADVRDAARIRATMAELRPDLVFHAAALKHVPMVEANPLEGLLTNACGTRHVADAARAAGASAMVMISTDKAVNPSSVMGASKRLAEMYCQGLDASPGGAMACVTVRFGNVLGSTGSVVPLFQRQLARGGPLTVTHPDMQRYFMTVREAVSLVLQASVVGAAARSHDGGIFVLDMGEPVRIVELARQMIRLAGLRPDEDVAIRYTGLRPGEKLFEELFHGREAPVPTPTPGLLMASPRTADPAIVGRAIDDIAAACHAGQTATALALLSHMVPEFDHNAVPATMQAPA